ncbi:putative lipoprotein [Mycobacterium marinum MB2]|nr:putative lipoprotein [Mycobacterium marinum MB2]
MRGRRAQPDRAWFAAATVRRESPLPLLGRAAAGAFPHSARTCGRRRRRTRRTWATAARSRDFGSCPRSTRIGSTATSPAPGSRWPQ